MDPRQALYQYFARLGLSPAHADAIVNPPITAEPILPGDRFADGRLYFPPGATTRDKYQMVQARAIADTIHKQEARHDQGHAIYQAIARRNAEPGLRTREQMEARGLDNQFPAIDNPDMWPEWKKRSAADAATDVVKRAAWDHVKKNFGLGD
jgi:hypothetical protein